MIDREENRSTIFQKKIDNEDFIQETELGLYN